MKHDCFELTGVRVTGSRLYTKQSLDITDKARYSEHYIKFHSKKERCKPLKKYRRKISVELINPLL